MNYNELEDSVHEINDEMNMCYYEVMLVLDICTVLKMETNITDISDELFNIICECVKSYDWTSDEFSENVNNIITGVIEYSDEEIQYTC